MPLDSLSPSIDHSIHPSLTLLLCVQEMSGDLSCNGFGAAAIALNTHDILCHIFEVGSCVANKSALSHNDLLRCALVSWSFCEPALRALWTNMSPPTPLWELLAPNDMASSQKTLASDFFDTILSGTSYSDPILWARFLWYARFVQELDITYFGMRDKHKELIHTLVVHNGGKSIFPSLRTLRWFPSSASDSSYFPLFIPQLHSATFDFPYPTKAGVREPLGHSFLARLRASSPRLDYLCVNAWWAQLGENHLGVISSFEHLTDLNLVTGISLTSFRRLATMPRMNSLQIGYVRSDEPDLSHSSPQIHAPHLTTISVGGNCPSLAQLFTALNAPALASASLHAISDHPIIQRPAHYDLCIQALATARSPTTMEHLYVTLDDDGGPEMCMYLSDLLDPLLVFPNLTYFFFACPMVGLVADDDDLWAIARGWPRLREFRLWQAYWDPCIDPDDEDSEGVPTPTPEVLQSFCDYCPDLRELVLPHLDFEADLPTRRCREASSAGSHGHGLKVLAFGDKQRGGGEDEDWMQEPVKPDRSRVVGWAQYVSDLFPHLDAEESLWECKTKLTTDGWREVLKQVPTLRNSQKGSSSGSAIAKSPEH